MQTLLKPREEIPITVWAKNPLSVTSCRISDKLYRRIIIRKLQKLNQNKWFSHNLEAWLFDCLIKNWNQTFLKAHQPLILLLIVDGLLNISFAVVFFSPTFGVTLTTFPPFLSINWSSSTHTNPPANLDLFPHNSIHNALSCSLKVLLKFIRALIIQIVLEQKPFDSIPG
jgi:hypothetical protein